VADDRRYWDGWRVSGLNIDRWTQEIRACCSLLAHTSSRTVSRIAIVLPKVDSHEIARELLRIAEQIAEEYKIYVEVHCDNKTFTLVFAIMTR
jgi:hypothetical protein